MRIKFLRIFPEMCASTWCLFSSSTRNIALGSGSITVAITSMASSLGLDASALRLSASGRLPMCPLARLPRWSLHFAGTRENPGPVGCNRHGMLKMRRVGPVRRNRGPIILEHAHIRSANVHHGLDGEYHAFLQAQAAARFTII